MDMQAKLARMAEKSKLKIAVDKDDKLANWHRVKLSDPAMGVFLVTMGSVFGKLAMVDVTLNFGECLKIR